jgi:hypothetical protein
VVTSSLGREIDISRQVVQSDVDFRNRKVKTFGTVPVSWLQRANIFSKAIGSKSKLRKFLLAEFCFKNSTRVSNLSLKLEPGHDLDGVVVDGDEEVVVDAPCVEAQWRNLNPEALSISRKLLLQIDSDSTFKVTVRTFEKILIQLFFLQSIRGIPGAGANTTITTPAL